MPVRGVPVGGSNIEASIIRYSTFSGLLCTIIRTLATQTCVLYITFPFAGREKKKRHVTCNESPLTVMLLYSSSNMSRKISSPCDIRIRIGNGSLFKKSHFLLLFVYVSAVPQPLNRRLIPLGLVTHRKCIANVSNLMLLRKPLLCYEKTT